VSYTTLVKNGYLVQGLEDISFSSARVFANVLAFLFASGTPGATIGGANGSFEPERGRPRSEGRMTALGHQKRFPAGKAERRSWVPKRSLLPTIRPCKFWLTDSQPRAVLCAAQHDEGVYRLHALT
jgi:hypothetical protein